MSGESAQHVRLVELLVAEISQRHHNGGNLLIFADHVKFGKNQPHRIGGFVPDLFASDIPESFRVVGEAKTGQDLNTPRSKEQIRAFLENLSIFPNPSFYLAVPWFHAAQAQFLVDSIKAECCLQVETEILRFR